jgi:hypothetical protein
MSKEKPLTKPIPKIYKRSAEDLLFFGFVRGQMQVVPTITLQQGIRNFFKHFKIGFDEWDEDCARTTYVRMQNEYFEECKS